MPGEILYITSEPECLAEIKIGGIARRVRHAGMGFAIFRDRGDLFAGGSSRERYFEETGEDLSAKTIIVDQSIPLGPEAALGLSRDRMALILGHGDFNSRRVPADLPILDDAYISVDHHRSPDLRADWLLALGGERGGGPAGGFVLYLTGHERLHVGLAGGGPRRLSIDLDSLDRLSLSCVMCSADALEHARTLPRWSPLITVARLLRPKGPADACADIDLSAISRNNQAIADWALGIP